MSNIGLFRQIVHEEKINFGIDRNIDISYSMIRSRVDRKSLSGEGKCSPIAKIEPKLVQLILCMSDIKRSLTSSEGLMLANDFI